MAQEGVYNENWRRLAAAVVLQAAIDYVKPRPVSTRNEVVWYKQSAKEFFERAIERKQERMWFEILGISPLALVRALDEGPSRALLEGRLTVSRQACGERINNGGRRERKS